MNDINTKFEKLGLVDLQLIDPTIAVDLKYATSDNFLGQIMYPREMNRAYCEKITAEAIVSANKYLSTLLPGYHILVWDAARPVNVQKNMYNIARGTPLEKYIANPYDIIAGGFHNYGLAVDLTIADENNRIIDMGTPFDSFEATAHPYSERELVSQGKISIEAYSNRMLLYHITGKFGLMPNPYEWWHYQLVQTETEKNKYLLIDF